MAKRVNVKGKATTLRPPGNPPHKIAAATGVITRSGAPGLGKLMEEAQQAAILQAAEDGISDPDEVKELMRAAREETKAEYERKAAADAAVREKEAAARTAAAPAAKTTKR